MKKKIVGIGEVLWDMLPKGKQLGGAPANFAYHASQFGHEGCIVSAVGNDALGNEIVELLNEKALTQYVARVAYPTGTVAVTLDANGVPQYEICTDVAWDNVAYTDELDQLARQTDCVVFGSLAQRSITSRTTITRFVEQVSSRPEALVIFDINLRQHFYSRQVIDASLRLCNILKINDEEIVVLAELFGLEPSDDMAAIATALKDRYDLAMVILTCGASHSIIFADEQSYLPTPKVEVVDTVGAGDSFTAAFAASLLTGTMSIKQAHARAVEVAAFVCTQAGAMP